MRKFCFVLGFIGGVMTFLSLGGDNLELLSPVGYIVGMGLLLLSLYCAKR